MTYTGFYKVLISAVKADILLQKYVKHIRKHHTVNIIMQYMAFFHTDGTFFWLKICYFFGIHVSNTDFGF